MVSQSLKSAASEVANDLPMSNLPPPNIYAKLNAVMAEVDYVQKEKRPGMRYSIVSHDAVTAKVRPILVKHGVVYYPANIHRTMNGNRTEVDMIVRFVSVADGSFIDVHSAGYGIDDQDKGCGKAISYAVKYALLKALGLESGDDPEDDQNTTHISAELAAYVEAMKTKIKAATTTNDLRPIDDDVKNAFQTHNIDEATAVALRGFIRQRVDELKRA